VLLLGALAAGIVGWTGVRIHAAKQVQAAVNTKRTLAAQKAVAAATAPEHVRTVRAESQTWQPRVEFEGSLLAAQSAALGFKVNGRISATSVKLGQVVKAGTLLGRLDANEAAAQVRSAEAQLRAAQAQLALAEDTARRTSSMVSSGALAENMGVQSTSQFALASAQLDAAKAGLALSQVNLQNQSLVAPFSGTVTRVPDGVGAVVSPSMVLFELMDLSALKLKGSVGESDANLIHVGAPVEISTEHGSATRRGEGRARCGRSQHSSRPARGAVRQRTGGHEATLRRVRARAHSRRRAHPGVATATRSAPPGQPRRSRHRPRRSPEYQACGLRVGQRRLSVGPTGARRRGSRGALAAPRGKNRGPGRAGR